MNLLNAARSGTWMFLGALLVAPVGTLTTTACGESGSCTRLRSDTYATKQVWETCDPGDPEPCIKVFGNPKDCTGVLTCDFAVNPKYRDQAQQTVLTIAEQSQGCYLCATPNCPAGDVVTCDPVIRRCLLVTALIDGGSIVVGESDAGMTQAPDAGSPEASSSDM